MLNRGLAAGLIAAALAGAVLAACGDDDDGGTLTAVGTGTTPTTTTPHAAASAVPEGVAAQYATLEEEIAEEGGSVESGDWRIAYIKEPAEGWFHMDQGHMVWRDPARGETAHLEVIPIERSTGRIVPDARITLEVLDEAGGRVERKQLSFYYAEFFHYAENFSIPASGEYTLRASVEAPAFRRHGDAKEGPALMEDARVEFENVMIDIDG
ncbi:MAG: hypothetical protein QOE69_1194 [Thermoleophilaceae bacterium]|nr:hypothetical protein [Thermoleophilaceae bacterium]MEA2407075.1 hypothetical protein [Thermoleophilaceae bacterium]